MTSFCLVLALSTVSPSLVKRSQIFVKLVLRRTHESLTDLVLKQI